MKTIKGNMGSAPATKITNSTKILVEKNKLFMNVSNFNTGDILSDSDRMLTQKIDSLLSTLNLISG